MDILETIYKKLASLNQNDLEYIDVLIDYVINNTDKNNEQE